jgi:hypothetical protein
MLEATWITIHIEQADLQSECSFSTTLWTSGAYPGRRMIGDSRHSVPGARLSF